MGNKQGGGEGTHAGASCCLPTSIGTPLQAGTHCWGMHAFLLALSCILQSLLSLQPDAMGPVVGSQPGVNHRAGDQ
jgi:hypothetical protein